MIEYALVRLAALKSLFVRADSLEKIMRSGDSRVLLTVLSESVFKKEVHSLIATGLSDIKPSNALRIIHKGHTRLRLHFSRLAKIALPDDFGLILLGWEMEEIKGILRRLSSDKSDWDRRLGFQSYFLDLGLELSRDEPKTTQEFVSFLKKAEHPLAFLIDQRLYHESVVQAELKFERSCFQQYQPEKISRFKTAERYFYDRLNLTNIQYALLIQENPQGTDPVEQFYIKGSGRITLSDFRKITKMPFKNSASIIKEKLRIALPPGFDRSPVKFCLEIKKALLKCYGRMNIQEHGGIWGLLFFMEELDTMVSDLKLAVYSGSSGAPHEEIADHFSGLKAA